MLLIFSFPGWNRGTACVAQKKARVDITLHHVTAIGFLSKLMKLRPRTTKRSFAEFLSEGDSDVGDGSEFASSLSSFEEDFVELPQSPPRTEKRKTIAKSRKSREIYEEDSRGDERVTWKSVEKRVVEDASEPTHKEEVQEIKPRVKSSQTGTKTLGAAIDHRQKAPLPYIRPHAIHRLGRKPQPLQLSPLCVTNSGHNDTAIADRVSRAWNRCAGPGPPWELLEDRMWYKETYLYGETRPSDIDRPLVHQTLQQNPSWKFEDAK